ncbi:two component transcriptional regulator, winged helix family [Ferrimonas balearica DSM 9799]|uniref:Two component transcriptional regulator, winged helix family n=1 Tax=Ferrimonas balearica (strain DSM 9799 / CCM 4581 / KCTC 23876 / PAT) TaxID=550540 RepID=E1SVE5_FERBD|nr:response regulator [Ferrimonas balearica]ADN74299.1 two component transcriptional regulator, winged helix family [Ferrimonas balearica DSM 9799]
MNRILLVEDDQGLCELLGQLLELEGFTLTVRQDGPSGLLEAQNGEHDIVLLDVMLPGLNGFDVLRQLRQKSDVPVLMLTARGDDIDRVVGLEIGADDYLPKPFNDRELIARIRAILRRTRDKESSSNGQDELVCDDLTLYPRRQEAWVNEALLPLTATEFSLLLELTQNPGELISKDRLSEAVLGKKLMPFDRSLDMHLSNLRRKLPERSDNRPRVKTVRGKGYIWLD